MGGGQDGLVPGRQEVGSPRGASVERWHLSRLPPESPASRDGCGVWQRKQGSGGRASRPRWVLGWPLLPQLAPCLLPHYLRELGGGGPLAGPRLYSLCQSRKKSTPPGGGQARWDPASGCSQHPSPRSTPAKGRMAVHDGNTVRLQIGAYGVSGRAEAQTLGESSSPLHRSPHLLPPWQMPPELG